MSGNKIKLIVLVLLTIPAFFVNGEFIFSFWNFFTSIRVWEIILFIGIVLICIPLLLIATFYLCFFIIDRFMPDKTAEFQEYHMVQIHSKRDFFSDNKSEKISAFTLNMVLEEFIFRFYALGWFLNLFGFDISVNNLDFSSVFVYIVPIVISSAIFSIYHIHMYIWTRSIFITSLFIVFSFLLGILLGVIFLYCGLIFAVIFHWFIVYYIYKLMSIFNEKK